MVITSGKVIQMDGLTFMYTEPLLYNTGMEEGIKANVNVIYSPAQCCKAAQMLRGLRTLKQYLDLCFINRYFVIGFSKHFPARVQEGNCYYCLHDTHLQEVSRMWQVPFKAK